MTRADDAALERRKVVALEGIALSLKILTGEIPMAVNKPVMFETPAPQFPKAEAQQERPTQVTETRPASWKDCEFDCTPEQGHVHPEGVE